MTLADYKARTRHLIGLEAKRASRHRLHRLSPPYPTVQPRSSLYSDNCRDDADWRRAIKHRRPAWSAGRLHKLQPRTSAGVLGYSAIVGADPTPTRRSGLPP